MIRKKFFVVCLFIICFALPACDTTESGPSICLDVSGQSIEIYNMWQNGGGVYRENVAGILSFESEISMDGETHVMVFRNIVHDYSRYTVVSFDVTIDGRSYSYPENRCSN